MKRIVAALLGIFLLSLNAGAQKVFYLFPEFTDGEILFQGMSRPARVKMNIDAIGQRIFYFQGDMLMELTNPDMVRTIKLGERMFLMKEGLLCEAIRQWESFTLLVNWKFKNVNVGAKGAMGATTQNKVDVLWTNSLPGEEVNGEGRYAQMGEYALDLWKMKGDNTYFFTIAGREYKAKRLQDLYKAFPSVSKELKAYAREGNLTLEKADDAARVIGHLVSLLQ